MPEMYEFNDANFAAEVLASAAPVLVDFTAEWCGPCHMLAPELAKLNSEWQGAVKVGQLDVDVNPNVTQQFGVMTLPTLLLFVGGRPVERLSGFMRKDRILAKLKGHLSPTA